MEVEIRLFATFRDFLPRESTGHSFRRTFEPGTTVADVVATLNLPPEIPAIVIVNGNSSTKDYMPEEGDVINIFPPVEGG